MGKTILETSVDQDAAAQRSWVTCSRSCSKKGSLSTGCHSPGWGTISWSPPSPRLPLLPHCVLAPSWTPGLSPSMSRDADNSPRPGMPQRQPRVEGRAPTSQVPCATHILQVLAMWARPARLRVLVAGVTRCHQPGLAWRLALHTVGVHRVPSE